MKTKLATAILLVGALQSNLASGLGLGEIDVDSGLNERFEAEIPLVNARKLDPSQIIVKLASANDFTRADVERPYFLNNLEFRVQRDRRGRQVLKVSTPDVMREPFLNFLLEVRWPNGRMLREYIVLLDLPIYSARSRSPEAQAGSQLAVVRKPRVVTRFEPGGQRAASGRLPSASTGGASSYTVRRNDSLWNIAKAVKPANVDINQAMVALHRENPHAFINNNINLLKNGAVLRVPTGEQLASISTVAANRVVSEQEKVWRRRTPKVDTDLRPLQDARTPATSETTAAGPAGRLTLSSEAASVADSLPKRGGAVSTTRATTAIAGISGNSEIARLQTELASSLENLDRAALENQSLVDRIGDVEAKFDDLERLLQLKDRELEQVRAALEQRKALLDSGQLDSAGSGLDSATAGLDSAAAELESAATSLAGTASDVAGGMSATDPAAAAAVPGTQPAPAQKGVLENLAGMFSTTVTGLLAALAGLGILLAGVFMWIFARRKDDYQATVFEAPEAPVFDRDDGFEPVEPQTAEPANDEDIAEPAAEDEFVERSFDGGDDATSLSADEPAGPGFIAAGNKTEASETPDDPLAEADIYLAYGRNEQASRMLEAAVEAEPLRTDLRMKLLEVYDEMGDEAQVEIHKAQLLTLDSSLEPEIDDLLGVNAGGQSSDQAQDIAAELGLDIDAGGDAGDSGETAAPAIASDDLEDEVATKLDLARAYVDMGDYDGAREILAEVVAEGSDVQADEAREMLARFG